MLLKNCGILWYCGNMNFNEKSKASIFYMFYFFQAKPKAPWTDILSYLNLMFLPFSTNLTMHPTTLFMTSLISSVKLRCECSNLEDRKVVFLVSVFLFHMLKRCRGSNRVGCIVFFRVYRKFTSDSRQLFCMKYGLSFELL